MPVCRFPVSILFMLTQAGAIDHFQEHVDVSRTQVP